MGKVNKLQFPLYITDTNHLTFLNIVGKFTFKRRDIADYLISQELVALQYIDNDGMPTENYPLNPNGSILGNGNLFADLYIYITSDR